MAIDLSMFSLSNRDPNTGLLKSGNKYQFLDSWEIADYDYKRSSIINNNILSGINMLTGVIDKYNQNKALTDYYDQVAQAQSISKDNARKLAQYKAQSIKTQAEFEASAYEYNNTQILNNINAFARSALNDYDTGIKVTTKRVGNQRAGYAYAGVGLTGSALDVTNSTMDESLKDVQNNYTGAINKINQNLAEVAQNTYASAITRYSAEQEAQFTILNTEASI